MDEPRPSLRSLVLVLGLLAAAFAAGCGDDDPATAEPVEVTLGDLTLTLNISKSTVSITDTVSAWVGVEGEADEELLDGFVYAWGWGDDFTYWSSEAGLRRVTVQFSTPGNGEIRLRVEDGEEEVELARTLTVTTGGADGSLDMITLPPGDFTRGDNRPGDTSFDHNTPQRQISVSQFSLARTEMTNATFATAINWAVERDLAGLPPNPDFLVWMPDSVHGQWVTILDFRKSDLVWNGDGVIVIPGRELHPVTGVSWAGAATACNWLSEMEGEETAYTFTPGNTLHLYEVTCDFTSFGYRLPTEAEWEKAARGGSVLPDGLNPDPDRPFPWGADPARVELVFGFPGSVRANTASDFPGLPGVFRPLFGGALPVGSFPLGRGPYGHDDLLGNAAEWCNDWFGYDYYEEAPDSDPPGTDEVYPGVQDWKVVRGDGWTGAYIPAWGSFTYEEGCAKRRWAGYHHRAQDLGFRVARSWQ